MLPAIVSLPEAITPEWLSQTLARHHPAFQTATISHVNYQMIGTGKMGDNARLTIEYTRDDDALPRSLVAKLPAADPVAKQMSASSGAYAREVLFYQQQAQHTDMHLSLIHI